MNNSCPAQCVRFKQVGLLQGASLVIEKNGRRIVDTSVNKRCWECIDCGRSMWLEASVDPNIKLLPAKRKKAK